MQTPSSDNTTRAITGDGVTWRPTVYADWAQDGYGAADSIDDLSGQADGFVVVQAYNDGLPDEVAYLGSSGIPSASCGLAGRDTFTPAQYFSPFRTDSPVFGFERDVAPVKIDQGAVGESGIGTVRLFTGQMSDAPVVGGRAALQAMSATRLLLSQLVQPPVRERNYRNGPSDYGLTASWPISYALHACAVYPSPPAPASCRMWLPMHGGGNPFIPSTNPYVSNTTGVLSTYERTSIDLAIVGGKTTQHIRGPFVGSIKAEITATRLRVVLGQPTEMGPGSDWMSQASSQGSIQFWIRGDAANVNTTPGGSGQFTWGVAPVAFMAGVTTSHFGGATVTAGVDVNRKVFVRVNDAAGHTPTLTSTGAIPSDGAWHFVGAAWNVSGNLLTVRLDTTTETNIPSPALVTSSLPATQALDLEATNLYAFALPPAEIQFCTGTLSNPTTAGWLNDTGHYTRRAYVYPSTLQMEVLAEKEPREALEYIGSLCKAEMASFRIDESDNVYVMPLGWFATVALQASGDRIDTGRHSARPDVRLDHSKVRNAVRVSYQQTWTDTLSDLVLNYTTLLTVPLGVSLLRLSFDNPAVRVDARSSIGVTVASSFVHLTAVQINGTDVSPPGGSYVTLNTAIDGTGTYSTQADVVVDTIGWDADEILLQFTNLSGQVWYLVNNSATFGLSFAHIGVYGVPIRQLDASVSETVDASVDTRGLRTLTVKQDLVQSEAAATILARRLALEFAWPLATVDTQVFGDPRRQPTDLVLFDDTAETGAVGSFRTQEVRHSISGAEYLQTLKMRQAYTVGHWGDGVSQWGRCRWAGQEVVVT